MLIMNKKYANVTSKLCRVLLLRFFELWCYFSLFLLMLLYLEAKSNDPLNQSVTELYVTPILEESFLGTKMDYYSVSLHKFSLFSTIRDYDLIINPLPSLFMVQNHLI